MRACMQIMERALAALARGEAVLPLRPVVRLPDGSGALAAMPAYIGEPRALGVKVISVFPGSQAAPHDSHQGAVLLFDPGTGSLLAIMDAGAITAARTAAVSGVATRLLARADAGVVALIGSGVQAHSHLAAMCAARAVREVRVWSRTPAHAAAFAHDAAARHGIPVHPAASARDAVTGADIVCTVTAATTPVVQGAWLSPGTHVNAVGSSTADARELDSEVVRRASCWVDRRESAMREAGDLLVPLREGVIGESHLRGELGDLILGRIAGRRNEREVTLFKSVGIAVEDVAAAEYVYRQEAARPGAERIALG